MIIGYAEVIGSRNYLIVISVVLGIRMSDMNDIDEYYGI